MCATRFCIRGNSAPQSLCSYPVLVKKVYRPCALLGRACHSNLLDYCLRDHVISDFLLIYYHPAYVASHVSFPWFCTPQLVLKTIVTQSMPSLNQKNTRNTDAEGPWKCPHTKDTPAFSAVSFHPADKAVWACLFWEILRSLEVRALSTSFNCFFSVITF